MRKRWCKHGFFVWVCYRQYCNIKQENKIVKPVTEEGTIKCYLCYVVIHYLLWNHKMLVVFINSWIVLIKTYNLSLIYLKRKFPIFLKWKCHQMESQFIWTTFLNDTNTAFCLNNTSFVPSSHLIAWSSWYYFS